MIGLETIRHVALSLPETIEQAHADKISFKVGKRIFATYNGRENRVCVKLSEIDQDVFSAFDASIIFPVPNKWGKQGWTLINLHKVPEEMLVDALTTAYCEVAPKKLAAIVNQNRFD